MLATALGACGGGGESGVNGPASLVGLPAPPEGSAGVGGVMLAGAGRGDVWSVDVLADAARFDHFDGSRWRAVPVPPSVATARGLAVISGGTNALWVAGRAAAAQARFVIARIHADGRAEQFDDALRTATGNEQLALFGRDGDAVVALRQAGLTATYRFDGQGFVALPAPPEPQARIVGAPPGGLWATMVDGTGLAQIVYRFDGASWSRVGTSQLTDDWLFDASGEGWAVASFGSTAVHFDGQSLSTVSVSPPSSTATVGTRFVLLPAGRGRAVGLYQRAAATVDGGHAVDVMYSVARVDGGTSLGVWRAGLTLDAPEDRGFRGALSQPSVLDDGTEVVLVSAAESRGSAQVRVAYALMAAGALLP